MVLMWLVVLVQSEGGSVGSVTTPPRQSAAIKGKAHPSARAAVAHAAGRGAGKAALAARSGGASGGTKAKPKLSLRKMIGKSLR